MKHCCQLNTIFPLVVYCLFLHGELHGYVAALSSDTHDTGEKENADSLSIPLVNDKGAPLVAMLDTNTINRKIKSYIQTLMRNMIQSSMQKQVQGIFKSSLEEDATIDFIRNITLQEINDALNQQVQQDKSTLMRDLIQSSLQEQIQRIFKTSLEENSTIDFIRNITLQEIKEQGKEDKNTLMRDMIQSSIQEQIQGIVKTSLKEKPIIEIIRNISLQEITDVLKEQGKEGRSSPSVAHYKDCTDLQKQTKKKMNDDVYTIYPGGDNPVQAYCDMTTDGGGWTVMLKRFGGSVNFKRTWVECENGFGDIHGEFWLGNTYTHMLTSSGKYELRVDMIDASKNKIYAVYKIFAVGDAASKYKLTVGDYSGNAGNKLIFHNGMRFSTVDQDNDKYSSGNCAAMNEGSWWYKVCSDCDLSRSNSHKPYWNLPIIKSVMMIRNI